jgi:hypothetical protein
MEVRRDTDQSVVAGGYLGADGTSTALVPPGTRVFPVLYADFEVPAGTPSDIFLRGTVKNAAQAMAYASLNAFNSLPAWTASGPAVTVTDPATLTVQALDDTPANEAAAFNIADQAVTFGLAVRGLEPTLRLPNLHLFWQAGQARTGFPALAKDTAGATLRQDNGRAVFQIPVRWAPSTSVAAGADAYNDGVLQQRFASLLFTPYTYPPDGRAVDSILRCDTAPFARTMRGYQGESTAAFMTGFCDFLSGAIRNSSSILAVADHGAVTPFPMDQHGQFLHVANEGEFCSDAVAVSLYGIWKNALGGGAPGLQTLWNATLSKTPNAYLNAPLGAYPAYLSGLAATLSPATWAKALGELALEDIGDVTAPSYWAGPALWSTHSKPFTVAGALHTFAPASDIYYDRDQATAHRFTQSTTGPCVLTMTPQDGQDFYLELIGPTGVVAGSYDQRPNAQPRTVSVAALPAGTYVARVRVGVTTAPLAAARYLLNVM